MDILAKSKLEADKWLAPNIDSDTQKEVLKVMSDNDLLIDSFSKHLEFGTGGMRGIMGVGINRINKYTIGKVTQGLANYLKKQFGNNEEISVVIAHDVRHNSRDFAEMITDILSANKINAYLFPDFCPTPLLSYAVRYLKCNAGIVLTASHNPPEYNGYKVYWSDGGQIVPPHDKKIIESVEKVDFKDLIFSSDPDYILGIPEELEKDYIKNCFSATRFVDSEREKLKIVFTPIHGTSVHLIPKTLKSAGFIDVNIVEEQAIPSGDFPTVISPNPEEKEALAMAMVQMTKTNADILIGTDPDADRFGVGIKEKNNEITILNGNEANTILIYFLLSQLKKSGKLNSNYFIGSTIVSSEIFNEIAAHFKINCKIGLTGFKWIAKMIEDAAPEEEFIAGGEESYGFLIGDFVRDKDSVSASLLFCEIASWLKSKNKTATDYLEEIYTKLSLHRERLISIKKEGVKGKIEIDSLLEKLRVSPPSKLNNEPVVYVEDYLGKPTQKNIEKSTISPIDIPASNVLIFRSENHKIAIRPSGTEPKIKFYLATSGKIESNLQNAKKAVEEKLDLLELQVNEWLV